MRFSKTFNNTEIDEVCTIMFRTKIYHVAHDLELQAHPDRERILNARQTWDALQRIDGGWQPVWYSTIGRRTSRDLGDVRSVPYVNDLFDKGVDVAGESGIVCWSNLDVCLVPEAAAIVRKKLDAASCCFSGRIDVDDARPRRSRRDLSSQPISPGTDLFAFRSSWWLKHRDNFPEMFISCEAFDFMLRKLMEQDNLAADIIPPILYHERHSAFWADAENRLHNPAQRHNRSAALHWCQQRGLKPPFL